MALGILKDVLSGNPVGKNFMSCVMEGCERCSLSFTFSLFTRLVDESETAVFSSNASSCFELFYDFDIVKRTEEFSDDTGDTKKENKLFIENEVLKIKTTNVNGNESSSKQLMFDARKSVSDDKGIAFGNKRMLFAMFAFYLLQYEILENMALFGRIYLQVIDTATTGVTNINSTLPLLIWQHTRGQGVYFLKYSLNMDKPTYVAERYFLKVAEVLGYVSNVLNKLVPDMELAITDLGKRLNEESKEEHGFEIISKRGGHSIPLRYESDGIRRMISILSLLIAAYNEESFTIAIDEIDSGIFEYLLGELLAVMSESMKGQFVFTAHNLRPLEVLPAKYLCFTTPNKEGRFTTINKRGNSNLQ